jgi:hypothetical protein
VTAVLRLAISATAVVVIGCASSADLVCTCPPPNISALERSPSPSSWLTSPTLRETIERGLRGTSVESLYVFPLSQNTNNEIIHLLVSQPVVTVERERARHWLTREQQASFDEGLRAGRQPFLVRGVSQTTGTFSVRWQSETLWVTNTGVGPIEDPRAESVLVLLDREPQAVHVTLARFE